jgi:hypothetical protein
MALQLTDAKLQLPDLALERPNHVALIPDDNVVGRGAQTRARATSPVRGHGRTLEKYATLCMAKWHLATESSSEADLRTSGVHRHTTDAQAPNPQRPRVTKRR